ncbi:MAG: prepilin-type N-terminal cleavage/methylation domain-containing protein [Phycisphaeraceae bacterium]|nr:MAG: prepilin-type N-terminal cleavage/methylation domain-containing protein [Phycisphaeraceae bacterium]
MISRTHKSARAFTLVEIVVVVAIIGLLLGVGLPALSQARRSAGRTESANNLRTLHAATEAYRLSHAMRLPYADRMLANIRRINESPLWAEPFRAIATFMDTQKFPGVDEDAVVTTSPPWSCRADRQIAPETGFSYAYWPAFDMSLFPTEHGATMQTSAFYTANANLPLYIEAGNWHSGSSNDDSRIAGRLASFMHGGVGPIPEDFHRKSLGGHLNIPLE